jgi:hypothetical protein
MDASHQGQSAAGASIRRFLCHLATEYPNFHLSYTANGVPINIISYNSRKR